MAAVREKAGMAMTARIDFGHGFGRTLSRCMHAEDRPSGVRSEQDHVLAIPRAASARGSVRQRARETAIDIQSLQNAVREETNGLAVRGPEGKQRAIGPGERALGSRLEIRSEEHTSELQSQSNLVCRLLLEK